MILFRDVVNDAVCGPWRVLAGWNGMQNWDGLRAWMEAEGGWDFGKLEVGSFDGRLMNYGDRLQFKVESRDGVMEVDSGKEVV